MPLPSFPLNTNKYGKFEVIKSASLQCTNMEGGNNKFYVLELQTDENGKHRLYSCYGRTGAEGVKEERLPSSMMEAEREFERIVKEKNKKGYRQVELASTSKGSEVGNTKILSTDVKVQPTVSVAKKCDLPLGVQALVNRLYTEAGEATQSQLSGRLQTSAKNPLGTLTLSQINSGKQLLLEANKLVATKTEKDSIDSDIIALTNEFYSAIPQEIPLRPKDEDGRKRWLRRYCLNNAAILDEKNDLLDLLSDVQGMITGFDSNNIQDKYDQINCTFDMLDSNHKDFKAAVNYVETSQSSHHHWRLKVKNVWKVNCKSQSGNDGFMRPIGNIQPLFHGSRSSNILGICRRGLLLRPPGAYVTGSMFGNGLYFADQSTKSSQYATARFGGSAGSGSSYFMFIADVALGKMHELYNSDSSLQKAPAGFHSVKGCKGRALIHNEFIIYDVKQNQLQYLIEFTQ